MAIKVKLKDGSGSVLYPQTHWSILVDKPHIFAYPLRSMYCIGDKAGFQVFYLNHNFFICVTTNDIAEIESNYTLGFATPNSIFNNPDTGEQQNISALFMNVISLKVEARGVVDDMYKMITLYDGDIDGNGLGIIGSSAEKLTDLITESRNAVTVPMTLENSFHNVIIPADKGAALCINKVSVPNIKFGDLPYLMMVTKTA